MQASGGLNPQEEALRGEALPASEGGTPPRGTTSGDGDPGERRKRRRLALLLVFLGLFSSGCAAIIWYAVTKQPLTNLPGVSLVTKAVPPRYVFSITGMTTPEGVAVSPGGGRIYVAESGGDRLVRVYDRSGRQTGALTPPGTQVGRRLPMSVAVAPDGTVFVTDRLRMAVDMYTPEGAYYGAYRPEAVMDEPWLPLGLSFDSNGRLLVTDHRERKHRVIVFRANEYLDTAFGEEGAEPGQFSFPHNAVADPQGRVYVSDSNNNRVSVFDRQGRLLSTVTTTDPRSGLALPRGLALDGQGRLYVADAGSHTVAVYEVGDTPRFLFSFGEMGTAGGEFRYPNSVAVDQQGWIYVADRGNNSVQVWSY